MDHLIDQVEDRLLGLDSIAPVEDQTGCLDCDLVENCF